VCVLDRLSRADRHVQHFRHSAAVGGGAVARIETRSIDYVPESERHGKVTHQGPFWFVGNFQPFTLALGFVGPSSRTSLAAWPPLDRSPGVTEVT
jgi:hypothetical protein